MSNVRRLSVRVLKLAEVRDRLSNSDAGVSHQMIQYLIPDDPAHLEALLAGDGVDDHVAVHADEVLAVEDGVLVLPGGVDDLDGEVLVAVPDDFAEGILDGGVVGVDEVAIDVLDGERALAWEGRR